MRPIKSVMQRYGLAVLSCAAASIVILPFGQDITRLSPFFAYYSAVAVSSWRGGTGPGLLATFIGAAVGAYFLLEPLRSFRVSDPGDMARLVLFVLVGILIACLNGALLKAKQFWKMEAAAARRSESRAKRLAEANLIGVFFSDLDGRVKDGNAEFLKLVGCTRQDLADGRVNWRQSTADEHQALNDRALDELRRCGVCTPFEKDHILRDGKRLPVLMGCALVDEEVDDCVGFVLDLTERKRAEAEAIAYREQLRAMDSELMVAEERERRRISNVLHDSVGQRLAMVQHKLRALNGAGADRPPEGPLAEVFTLVDEAVTHTRSLTSEISPPVLYELGLGPALQWLADRTGQRHAIVCGFEGDGSRVPLSDEARIALFQAVRELLFNIVKHANARSCRISMERLGDVLKVVVYDDGVGFAPQKNHRGAAGDGFGLFNIRERLSHLGGTLDIKSAPGSGTAVELTVPLQEERNSP